MQRKLLGPGSSQGSDLCGQAVWAALGIVIGIWAGEVLHIATPRSTAGILAFVALAFAGLLLAHHNKQDVPFCDQANPTRSRRRWAAITIVAGALSGASIRGATSLDENNFALWPPKDSVLVSIEGRVVSRPTVATVQRRTFRGEEEQPITQLSIECARLLCENKVATHGVTQPGLLCVVWVDGELLDVQRGDLIRLQGWAKRPRASPWPGGFDQVRWARHRGIDLLISVPEPALIDVLVERKPVDLLRQFKQLQDRVHHQTAEAAIAGLSPEAGGTIRALLLGQRVGREFSGLMELLQRLGVAHLLAISGLHLAIAIGLVVVIARAFGMSQRGVGVLMIGLALLALFLVEVRPPLLRAATMAIFVGASLVLGRGLMWTGTLAMAAIALLILHPRELAQPGFQMSFGVVIGLIALAPSVARRWNGPQLHSIHPRLGTRARSWAVNLAAASLVAWIVATPLVAYHFRIFSPFAAPLSAALLLPITILMVLGAVHISLGVTLGVTCPLVCWVIECVVTSINTTLSRVAHWPGTWWPLPEVSVAIVVLGLVWAVVWSLCPHRKLRRWLTLLGTALYVGLVISSITLGRSGPMRIDMLAVGDGSAYLLRSGKHTALFDTGSQRGPVIGPRTIAPALYRLGVRKLDLLILSHAHQDHISGALHIIEKFNPKELIVSPRFLEVAESQRQRASGVTAQSVLERARVSGTDVVVVEAGASWQFGDAKFTCLAPKPGTSYESHNDESLVIQIDVLGRRLLFCGDIEDQGIESLLKENKLGTYDVVEAPHHGEESGAAIELLNQLKPLFVLQSSSERRDGQWIKANGRVHLHTSHDGTCSIDISEDGRIQAQRFNGTLEQEPHGDG